MNLFNEAIYGKYLEHTAPGTKWDKHKYLYITPSGRYVYPSDLENVKTSSNPALAKAKNRDKIKAATENAYKDQIRSAHQGSALRNDNSISRSKRVGSSGWRTQAINTIDGQRYSKQIEAQKRAEEEKRKSANSSKVSGTATGSKTVSSTPETRNTINIKKNTDASTVSKTEEKKTETNTTGKDGEKYKNMSEEMKQMLLKDEEKKSGKKSSSGSGKKKSGGSSKKGSSKASTKTEEAGKMGLTDDDLKNMEVNTQATDREEVLKNIALRVIRGDYGNGNDRKAKLGNYYDEVQKRVNELMKSGQIQREGQAAQQTSQKTEQKTPANTTKSSTEKTETQKKNAEEISIAKQLAEISGMKNSATLNLVRLYKKDTNSKDFKEELDSLAEGDEKQKQRMLRILGYMKHSDLEEGNFLMHWGKKHRSGRYAYGSGGRPYQHEPRNHSWRDRRTMPDEDLNAALNRARKELDLYNAERNNRSAGQKFVEDVLTSVGKSVLIGAGTGAIKYAGRQFVMKELENEDLANAMFGGGGKKKGKKDKK